MLQTCSPRLLAVARSLLAIAMALTAVGCSVLPTMSKADPTPTPLPAPEIPDKPTYIVQRGFVEQTVSFSGRVSPAVEVELFFRQDGRVSQVYVENDDMVEAGQVLAELDNADLYQQIEQAQLELAAVKQALVEAQASNEYARARAQIALEIEKLQLAKLEAQSNRADLTIAQANLQAADAERKLAQRDYDERARQGGVEASSQALALERATINYTIVRANYDRVVAAGQQHELDLEIARKQLELTQLEFDHLATEVDSSQSKAVTRNELTLERLQSLLSSTIISSTIAGRVTSLSAYEGRTVEAFKPVIVVSDESTLEITSDPSTGQKKQLTEGMAVSISLPAFPGTKYAGTITKLPYPYGSGGGGSVEDTDTRMHITVSEKSPTLVAGDLVHLVVTLQRSENALWLPPAAIQRFSGRRFVLVDEGGRQRPIDVKVGIESADRVEILEGLEEGQVVVGQ
jgi:multidrug efflux pump subunit AcrA (membrane-fusion protein)